jgi:hypothetical protein
MLFIIAPCRKEFEQKLKEEMEIKKQEMVEHIMIGIGDKFIAEKNWEVSRICILIHE